MKQHRTSSEFPGMASLFTSFIAGHLSNFEYLSMSEIMNVNCWIKLSSHLCKNNCCKCSSNMGIQTKTSECNQLHHSNKVPDREVPAKGRNQSWQQLKNLVANAPPATRPCFFSSFIALGTNVFQYGSTCLATRQFVTWNDADFLPSLVCLLPTRLYVAVTSSGQFGRSFVNKTMKKERSAT